MRDNTGNYWNLLRGRSPRKSFNDFSVLSRTIFDNVFIEISWIISIDYRFVPCERLFCLSFQKMRDNYMKKSPYKEIFAGQLHNMRDNYTKCGTITQQNFSIEEKFLLLKLFWFTVLAADYMEIIVWFSTIIWNFDFSLFCFQFTTIDTGLKMRLRHAGAFFCVANTVFENYW